MAQVLNYARLRHIPDGAVYIGRGMPNIPENPKFKNPFKMHDESQRQEVCDKYRNHLWAQIKRGKSPRRTYWRLTAKIWCAGARQKRATGM